MQNSGFWNRGSSSASPGKGVSRGGMVPTPRGQAFKGRRGTRGSARDRKRR